MTEEEAKTRWCPFTRAGFADAGGVNNRPDGTLNCIAYACMAWRWSGPVPPSGGPGSADFAIMVLGTDEQRAEIEAKLNAKRPGFCGLAGKP